MIEEIKNVFIKNKNKYLSSKEVYEDIDKSGYVWGANKRGAIGHRNMVNRDLSSRYLDKFEVDTNNKKKLYRLKTYSNKSQKNIDKIENIEYELEKEKLGFEEYDADQFVNCPRRNKKGQIKGKHIDYEKKNKNNKKKGDIGEEAIVIYEEKKLINLKRKDLADKVQWISKKEGDGLGYDIISWEIIEGKDIKIYIEVKTTEGSIKTPFEISSREVEVSEELGDRYYIYRIFGLKSKKGKVENIKLFKIRGSVNANFKLVPNVYIAYSK